MRIIDYSEDIDLNNLLHRDQESNNEVESTVREIIANIKLNGDKDLKRYTQMFDKAEIDDLTVSLEETDKALSQLDDSLIQTYREAAKNIKNFHEKQLETTWTINPQEGILLGQKITPIQEVGIYVPGGKAAYPSTVLMDAIPAKVAGVKRLVMVTPPDRNGNINPHILAAAKIAGVDEIYKVGGAQAIAALAYGTESIKPVSKIVGPGNIFVATAKKEVFGQVDIDMIAGPSEVLIIADSSAIPEQIAADLLAQAEHDQLAMPILITSDSELADQVVKQVDEQLNTDISRKEIAQKSIENNGIIFLTQDLKEAFKLANEIAPEHLELNIKDAHNYIDNIENAGAIFIGSSTPEPVGDYFAGPNHTLPTSGTAKFSSPLGVYDFLKRTSLLEYSPQALENIGKQVIEFAESEGLDAHANSIRKRIGVKLK